MKSRFLSFKMEKPLFLALFAARLLSAWNCELSENKPDPMTEGSCDADSKSALDRARQIGLLGVPKRNLKQGGEIEGEEFWRTYDYLFSQAWKELPKLHPELYIYDEQFRTRFLSSHLLSVVEAVKKRALDARTNFVDEREIRDLLHETTQVDGVFQLVNGLFTDEFRKLFLEELDYLSNSGIPMRRPNGMNRYGAILGEIGFQSVFDGISREYLQPIVEMLYPNFISHEDASDNYAFIVDYQKNADPGDGKQVPTTDFDVDLKEHKDSSIATLNVCLGYDNFTGGNLVFIADEDADYAYDASKGSGEIKMTPGLSILHKGQHKHGALPITGGRRVNLIVWLMGKGGYVRITPYPLYQQMNSRDRWLPKL
ncbi:2-oxoglutarate and iron-dependent oxygenase domain-containing protein 2-like [Convolutriloba macropyga]|uniref:2-oxoglutarate and iron-dependent oxygenase domain-containing protein 2-like n=1 Tax=Convolutriloba macropyga TaxID=536237 RepID=UPI003F51F34E